MKTGILAFDYDGVLADTFEPNIRLINRIFLSMGSGAVITKAHFDIAEEISFEAVVTAAGLDTSLLPEFMKQITETGSSIIAETFLFKGINDLLEEYKEKYYLAVVSNNSTHIICPGLEKEGVYSLFDLITGSDENESKAERLRNLQELFGIEKNSCWMIGDGVNDIEAAHEADWKSLAVTWGFQSREVLQTRSPSAFADTLEGMRELLGSPS